MAVRTRGYQLFAHPIPLRGLSAIRRGPTMLKFETFRKSGDRFTDSLPTGCRPPFLSDRHETLDSCYLSDLCLNAPICGAVAKKPIDLAPFQNRGGDTYGTHCSKCWVCLSQCGNSLRAVLLVVVTSLRVLPWSLATTIHI